MKPEISFFVAGDPKPQPRPRSFARKFGDKWSARNYDPGTAEGWKSQIALAALPFIPAVPIAGPVRLRIVFHLRRPKDHYKSSGELKPTSPVLNMKKPDLDNYAKAVMDALTQLSIWRDDSQVAELVLRKIYATHAGADVSINELED